MEGSASPRKPSVAIESRSLTSLSLLVAWRSKASRASSRSMPQPSSAMRIRRRPPLRLRRGCGGAGVERVLEQFFDDGGGALDHFAGGDLVGDLIGKNADAAHREMNRPRAAGHAPTSRFPVIVSRCRAGPAVRRCAQQVEQVPPVVDRFGNQPRLRQSSGGSARPARRKWCWCPDRISSARRPGLLGEIPRDVASSHAGLAGFHLADGFSTSSRTSAHVAHAQGVGSLGDQGVGQVGLRRALSRMRQTQGQRRSRRPGSRTRTTG